MLIFRKKGKKLQKKEKSGHQKPYSKSGAGYIPKSFQSQEIAMEIKRS